MRSYAANMSVHMIIRKQCTQNLPFLQIFDGTDLHYSANAQSVNQLLYIREEVYVDQTKCGTDS